MFCRHCRRARASRPRRLCWNCFYDPKTRRLYPKTSKFARLGAGLGTTPVTPPPYPTTAPPGSPEKIAIMQQRAEARQELFHPKDAPFGTVALTPARAG